MDNSVGSIDINKLLLDKRCAYILGLWCADGYHRTSSIGLSNINEELLETFSSFLLKIFPKERLRIRAYYPPEIENPKVPKKVSEITRSIVYYPLSKAKHISCHLYVNSRPLLRIFKTAREKIRDIDIKAIPSYIAGRFDGDGSVNKTKDKDFRIIYGNYKEAKDDRELLRKIGIRKISIYHYKEANTYCLYVWRAEIKKMINLIIPFSDYLKKRKYLYPVET